MVQIPMDEIITLDYGSGGKKTSGLIENKILPAMKSETLNALGDGAILGDIVFSTDSFVVDPIFFPGGDIGKLAVNGTVNDISMCGGDPRYLSCAFIIEEGLPMADLEKIIDSISEASERAKVKVVTGDTKVVERGRGDKIYINTAGIGFLKYKGLDKNAIRPGDKVIVSGTVGDHGTAVMMARSGFMNGTLLSDCAPLNKLCDRILSLGGIKVLRDPTRGGLATTLNEFTENSKYSIELKEDAIPIKGEVNAVCDMLGLDPLYCANEGKMICIVSEYNASKVLDAMRECEYGKDSAIIGTVTGNYPGKVVIHTKAGGSRIIQKLTGTQLPRIC